ncbi:hypothetical protein OXX59_000316 [Metschnikowia pulcherrima]
MSINRISIISPLLEQRLPFDLRVGEVLTFKSRTGRQTLSINSQDAKGPIKVRISVTSGYVFVTSQRFVYITEAQGDLESFYFDFASSDACQFSHALKSPWFGPNYWSFMFFSPSNSSCDGFPTSEWFQGQISFKDGGLFDFIAAIDGALNDAVNNSHIDEELPRYSQE